MTLINNGMASHMMVLLLLQIIVSLGYLQWAIHPVIQTQTGSLNVKSRPPTADPNGLPIVGFIEAAI
jgi:hypothetical protein